MSQSIEINDDPLSLFKDKIEEAKKTYGVKDSKELKSKLPKSNRKGDIVAVNINDIALTDRGELTSSKFFKNLNMDTDTYGDIALTKEEASKLVKNVASMTTGVNSVVPMSCNGDSCAFKDSCWLAQNGKAPLGKPCLIENELLKYHTMKFIEEYNIDFTRHSEVMLVQELSELIVYEMRLSRHLAKSENALLSGIQVKMAASGAMVEEETIHWAWTIKERIKDRRLKILDALMGTRKAQALLYKNKKEIENNDNMALKEISDILNNMKEDTAYSRNDIAEADYSE